MNANLLRAKIVERGETQKSTAHAIGMSENSLCRKLAGKREFTLGEVSELCAFLGIENPASIFLPKMSQKCNDGNGGPT